MKRTKRITGILSAAVAALLLTTSCNDSYPGLNYEPNPDDQPKNDEDLTIDKTPIKLYTNNPAYFSIVSDTRGTRGTGAFENDEDGGVVNKDKYLLSTFHVFAFRAYNPGGQGVLTIDPDMQRSAYSPDKVTSNDPQNTSCLLDGPDYNLGMPFRFENDQYIGTMGSLVKQYNEDLYYSDRYQDVGYNFFGYYVDDFKPTNANTHRGETSISYDIDIDGYRDILVGYAKPLIAADFEDGGIYDANNVASLTKEDKEKILSIPGNYSTYAAHRNVNPIIDMKHQLVLLKFSAYAGAKSARKVTITGIEVETMTKAKMTVTARNLEDCGLVFDESQEKTPLPVGEVGDNTVDASGNVVALGAYKNKLRESGYPVVWKDEWSDETTPTDVKAAEAVRVGAGILVAPQKSYKVTLTYYFYKGSEENPVFNINDPLWEKHETEYKIAPVKKSIDDDPSFDAGFKYNIKIGVYGLEKIEMGGSVKGWKSGDDITINPDDDPNNPNINQK